MNILITSVGRRSYMIDYFKKALKEKGSVHAGNNELTYALQKADQYLLTPKIYDESYIDVLLGYCKKHHITSLISLFDIDLPILAKNKERFEEIGVRLLISDFNLVSICNDKWATYQFLKENNFHSPLSFITLRETKEALAKKELGFPLIVKPRWGMGSIGVFQADNKEELSLFYQKTKKEIQNSYLRYESQFDLDKSIIIQEKLKGDEWGLDIFNDLAGNFLSCVPKHKFAMRAGETDIAKTIKDPELIKFGKKIAKRTRHIGNLDLDFFIMNGKYFILELNCRFGGQYPFSHIAGVDFPNALINMLRGEKPDPADLVFEEIKAYKDFEIRKS